MHPPGDKNDPTTLSGTRLASATGKSVDDPLGPDAFDGPSDAFWVKNTDQLLLPNHTHPSPY